VPTSSDYERMLRAAGLHMLTAADLVRRFQPSGSVARCEARVRDNHPHFVCRSCGAIADVDGAVGDTACLTAPDTSSYDVGEAEVIFWGSMPGMRGGNDVRRLRQPAITTRKRRDREEDRRDREVRPE
jgi:hypothetical protein